MNIFRLGFLADENDFLAGAAQHFRLVCIEDATAAGGAGRGRQALGQRYLIMVWVEARMQQLFEVGRIDAEQGLILADQPFGVHLDGGADHGRGVHLAVAGLQAIQHTLFDGVLVVLNLAVVGLQLVAKVDQLPVKLGHFVSHLRYRLGGANAGDDVLALGVDQILAVHFVLAGTRVAGEADAGGAIVAHVAEYHGDDIDGGAVGHLRGDVEFAAVVDGALAHPGVEDGADADFELLVDVFRKGLAGFPEHDGQEAVAGFAQMFGFQGDVGLDAGGALDGLELLVEMLFIDAQGDLAEQLDEATIGVVAEADIAGLLNQAAQGGLIEAQVENGVHHARHGHGRAGTHRDQQRVGFATEFLAGLQFQRLDVAIHLLHQFMG